MNGKTQPAAGSTPERVLPPKKKATERKMQDVLRRAELARQNVDEVTQMTKRQAMGLLGKRRAQAARQAAIKKGGSKDDTYYVECERCNGPAFFMSRRSGGPLKDEEWWSTYKMRGMPFSGNEPYCQCCFEEGRGRIPVRIVHWGRDDNSVNGRFRPLDRLVRLVDRASLEELVREEREEVKS